MGRTLPSFMQLIEHERHLLHKFRRALPKEDQTTFDELIQDARFHAAEGAYVAHYDPLAIMLLSMLLEHHKRLREIEGSLKNPH